MPFPPAKILIAEDESSIRLSMSLVLTKLGYHVRSAADGFSALREIRVELPDILLSDLNMPGMSGFELLTIVRRRLPSIKSVAMSGAFSGEGIPPGVAADAFYQKGSSTPALLRIIQGLPRIEQCDPQSPSPVPFVWVNRDGHASCPATIVCPECLRTFPQLIDGNGMVGEGNCAHCRISIQYRMLRPSRSTALLALQNEADHGLSAQHVSRFSN
jgi:CheY-like chemotaxis protein